MREEYSIPKGQPNFKLYRAILAINLLSLGIDPIDNDQVDNLHYAFIATFIVKEEIPILKLY